MDAFKFWLIKNSSGELLLHAKRSDFPKGCDYRKFKAFWNSKYLEEYIPDKVILEFERKLDEYEALKAGEEIEYSGHIKKNKQCKKAG
jgi:hypothetical protein